ncbi:MAG: efflux RND transporter periplasmic adaptor subunit [Pseudomonadales bacterium]|nr:efflux RND transporter periplasmic adaptor subunit [Pseudomonadales bacterium]
MKNKILMSVIPVIILAAGGGAFALLDAAKPEPEKKTEEPRSLSVHVQLAETADLALRVSSEGEVRPRTEVTIVAQVAGRVVSVSSEFTEGGIVTPGATLLQIEDTDYRLAVVRAKSAVAEAEVGIQEAEASADVARKQLRNAQNASPLALKQPQVARARAMLVSAKSALSQAELNLSRTKITLPFHGRLNEKNVNVGQYVSLGTPLGKAFSTDYVEVRLPFNDSQLASLDLPIGFIAARDEHIKVNLSAKVAGKIQQWEGKLVRLDASINSQTRTLYGQVEVAFPYTENVSQHSMPLAVGLYVKAEIEGRKVANATLISREGLRAGNRVFVVSEDGKLEVRNVNVVHSSPTEAIIDAGIEPLDKVIISSIRNPIPGMALSAIEKSSNDALPGGG